MNSLCNVNQSRTYRYISIDEIQNSIQLYAVFSKTFILVYSAPRKSENTVIANSGVNLLMAVNKKDMV